MSMTLRSSLFRHSQVHQFPQCQDPNFPLITLPSGLDDLVKSPFNSKTLISGISDHVSSFENASLSKIRADWVDEIGENLEEMWERALLRVNLLCQTKHDTVQESSSHPLF